MRFLFRCEGWYSWPFVLCRTCSKGVKVGKVIEGTRAMREAREGKARRREDAWKDRGRMGRRGSREEAKEVEGMARGTAEGMTGGRDKSRASEGGIRGIFGPVL